MQILVSKECIRELLSTLNKLKSAWLDGIHLWILKELGEDISEPPLIISASHE